MIKKRFSRYLFVASLMTSTFLSINNSLAANGMTSGAFQVRSEVAPSCTVSALPLDFGNYVLDRLDATSTITLKCTTATNYEVMLSGGQYGNLAQRKMADNATGDTLNYGIYTDSGRSVDWGGTPGYGVTGTGDSTYQTITVYGTIPADQPSQVGSYRDTINVIVLF